ncbi:MAG: UDP-2,3-diacylglucosamine diphosphatase LpxI [Candidatus Aminicenantales bacterium]
MESRIGIIAGSGRFPLQALDMARDRGLTCVVAAIRGEAAPELEPKADAFAWFGTAELVKLIAFFKERNVREIILVGKVEPRTLFRKDLHDEVLARLLAQAKDETSTSVLESLIEFLGTQGIVVLDPSFFLEPYFCGEGVLTRIAPSPEILKDIEFGWTRAKSVADLDIGQTLVVKNKAIVAVEDAEGTDETIKRAGRLAGEGAVVLKVGRTRQDMRIDVPAVGLKTMKGLVGIRAAALAIEARNVLFFQKGESLEMADANGITVVAGKQGTWTK